MFKQIQKDLGGVDVCINNAGLSHCAPLLSGSTADWKNMLDVNFNFFKFSAPYFKALVHEYCNENIKICFLWERERDWEKENLFEKYDWIGYQDFKKK